MAERERDWQLLPLGGASGTGESEVGYRPADEFGTPIVEVDDLVIAVEELTAPQQQPVLHYWRTPRRPPSSRRSGSSSCTSPSPR